MLYDGHDWQSVEALVPVIRTINDSFAVNLNLEENSVEDMENVFLLVWSPSHAIARDGNLNSDNMVLTVYKPEYNSTGTNYFPLIIQIYLPVYYICSNFYF